MSTLTIAADRLAAALKHGVASARNSLPVLRHVRVTHAAGMALFETTDCEVWVQARVPAECTGEFDVLLHDELLRPVAAGGAGDLVIQLDGKVRSGRGRYAIPAMASHDFPTADDVPWEDLQIDPAALCAALRAVSYTGEDQSLNPIFRALHVVPGFVWCTDGRQAGVVAIDYDGPAMPIPVGQVPRVIAALQQDGARVQAAVGAGQARQLRVSGPELQLSLRLVEGAGADIPGFVARIDPGAIEVTLRRDCLAQALRRFMPFVNYTLGKRSGKPALPTVALVVADGEAALRDKSGEFVEALPELFVGDFPRDWRVAFDVKRMLSVLAAIDTEHVLLHPLGNSGGTSPTMLMTPEGAGLDRIAHVLAALTE